MSVENRELAIQHTLKYEGGYTNDAADPGGPTNWGITIADARHYWKADAGVADMKAMPLSVAVEIYRKHYWIPVNGDALPSGLDFAVFDFGVNSGVSRSLKYLAVTNGTTQQRIEQLCDARLQFLMSLKTWANFGKGWGRRVADVKTTALSMANKVVPPVVIPPPPDIPRPDPASIKPAFSWGKFIADILGAIFKKRN